MTSTDCPFCAIPEAGHVLRAPYARALWDRFPVSPGHALVVPRRHVESWFEATREEQDGILRLIDELKGEIERHHAPDGYNIGINIGAAAGQTVPHLHVHVIPRYAGDVPDPRGGVRFVLPERANYLASPVRQGAPHDTALVRGDDDPLLPHLVAHLDHATTVDLAVSFVLASGVALLEEHLRDVIARGGRVRILTGAYLDITEPDALLRLLDLGEGLSLRSFDSGTTAFHLKSYLVHGADGSGTAFVGSSNLSRSALRDGFEWNHRVLTSRDGAAFRDVARSFEALFADPRAQPVDAPWIERYRARRRVQPAVAAGVTEEPLPPPPPPHAVQQEALVALTEARRAGHAAALVVLATGLGKTWLSAFDSAQAGARRVLFVAHREEILAQAQRTFRRLRPSAILGTYTGTAKATDVDVLFASVQTMGRRAHLARFSPDAFDYIVIDEFHHAAAPSYRRLLDHFSPSFLLGLTATPERSDGGDLLALCGDNLAYRCDLAEGIRRGLLAPFDYFGVPDDVDYDNIPWRSSRFDEAALTAAVATEARARNALENLDRYGGGRTIAFCVSQRHATYMRDFLVAHGRRAAVVHAGPGSDPRAHSLERLASGELDVLCAVDMFNEGVDLPDVDTVLMLRPTESQVLWLQQFGRGLRWKPGKRLRVIDYIGNHRAFLLKPRALLAITGGDVELSYALRILDEGTGAALLPDGCSVTYELEARDILRDLLASRSRAGDALDACYRELREARGTRPTAREVHDAGFDPKAVRATHGSWLQYVRAMGDLSTPELLVEEQLRPFLSALDVTDMSKSYKMLVLLAMVAEDQMPGALDLARLGERVAQFAARSPTLRREMSLVIADPARMRDLLERQPIAAWVGGRGTGQVPYFKFEAGRFETAFTVAEEHREAAAALVRELAEWRLAAYLRRVPAPDAGASFTCRVSQANGSPMLFLPDRDTVAGLPTDWETVHADGHPYRARFVKVAVNVLRTADDPRNILPEVLRRWFGPRAGAPGTVHRVTFREGPAGWVMEPVRGE